MITLPVYIPMAIGQTPADNVIGSIRSQVGVDPIVTPVHTHGVVNSQRNADAMPYKFRTLRRVQRLARFCGSEYIGLNDRDIVHLDERNYFDALVYLYENPSVDMVAFNWEQGGAAACHVRNGACIVKASAFQRVRFDFRPGICTCLAMMESITCKYLDKKQRIFEVL